MFKPKRRRRRRRLTETLTVLTDRNLKDAVTQAAALFGMPRSHLIRLALMEKVDRAHCIAPSKVKWKAGPRMTELEAATILRAKHYERAHVHLAARDRIGRSPPPFKTEAHRLWERQNRAAYWEMAMVEEFCLIIEEHLPKQAA